jgi:hypothetical protein
MARTEREETMPRHITLAILAAASLLVPPRTARAQTTQIKPRIYIIFDTSGSMDSGDRITHAKNALRKMFASAGDVEFHLTSFMRKDKCADYPCSCFASDAHCSDFPAGDNPDVLVDFPGPGEDNVNELYSWVDLTCVDSPENPELEANGGGSGGGTSLGPCMALAKTRLTPRIGADPYRGCRPYHVLLITDGHNSCWNDGDVVDAVVDLWDVRPGTDPACASSADCPAGSTCDTGSGECVYSVSSYVIGIDITIDLLDDMADAGDDGTVNGSTSAFYTTNEDEISAALARIVEDSIFVEVCNGVDDDCDGEIDEGFTLYCDIPGGHPDRDLCVDPGETLCDGADDNCDGTADEGLLNDCGTCGTLTEVCDGADNDCDGFIDEGDVCDGCTPEGEVCDNADNDCDDVIDNDLTRVCGTDVGECTAGTQTCTAGSWGSCVGEVGPDTEECNGLDDDCDGLVDGFTESCGSDTGECEYGYRICLASTGWTSCMGGVGPTDEVCDNADNDCDGEIDDGNPGGGAACGTDVGECTPGVVTCVGGALLCSGGTPPVAEECNGLDDDCDGDIDEGNPEGGDACGPELLDGIGICEAGLWTCVTTGPGSASLECIGAVEPTDEECNGLDDDCDEDVDEGLVGGDVCGTDVGECTAGTEQCVDGAWVCEGGAGPTDEVCDGLDNDCDGEADEGNPEGGVVCGTDVGECEPGVTLCDTSLSPPDVVCFGEVGPADEVCDALDNDCDGYVDEGLPLGDECGTDVGECQFGNWRCTVDGELDCVGEVGPRDEVCDGLDNDCDGVLDDEAECPVEDYICWEGYCVGPCDPDDEWPCSTGRACEYLDEHGGHYCVGDPCEGVVCDDPCTQRCYGGSCRDKCHDVVCGEDQTCVVDEETCTPECVRADCYAPGYECDEDERCVMGECEPDPCHGVTCGPDEFCREGECVDACVAEVDCEQDERCQDGACVDDPCAGVECTGGLVCDPETGTCIGDPCEGVVCPEPQVCDPETGTCVDEPCSYIECPEGFECVWDQCVEADLLPEPDETPELQPDASTDATTAGQDIVATGAGGCAGCSVTGGTGRAGAPALVLALLALAVGLLGRRRLD